MIKPIAERVASQKVSLPQSASDYGDYQWHLRWTISLAKRKMVHTSGIAFSFEVYAGQQVDTPSGGRCPAPQWFGLIENEASARAKPLKDHVALRLCYEALRLWSDVANFVCLDCSRDTLGDHYYMVTQTVWSLAHPMDHGMLCLDCLSGRLGRSLRSGDFIDCPVNDWSELVCAIRRS